MFFVVKIQQKVCEYFNIPINKMIGKTRKHEIVVPRQVAMYLSKKYTDHTLKAIGLRFGGRDHSTVIHAINSVRSRMRQDPKFKEDIETIEEDLVDITEAILASKYY